MTTKVSVNLPDKLFLQTQNLARRDKQDIEQLIFALIEEGVATRTANVDGKDWPNPDPAVEREMQAYIAMHPKLKDAFLGKYVAIYHGELIDHDSEMEALFERIDAKYPDEFVWLSRVESEPIETIHVRSPRIMSE